MFPDVHDSQVIAYSVDSRTSEVLLHLRAGPEGAPLFAIRFQGSVAHKFPHALMPSWAFDLVELPAEVLLAREWDDIAEGFRLAGWPGNWADSLENALAFCKVNAVVGYDLESSYGMYGWVLASSVERVNGP